MHKTISTFLITSLLASCVAHDMSPSPGASAIIGIVAGDTTTPDLSTAATDDDMSWIDDGFDIPDPPTPVSFECDVVASGSATTDVIFRAGGNAKETDITMATSGASAPTVIYDQKTVTIPKLVARFVKGGFTKVVKTADAAMGVALQKMLSNKGLAEEAKDAITLAMKTDPTAAGGVKALVAWLKAQKRPVIVLGVIAIAIREGLLPYVFDELLDSLKEQLFGIKSQETKYKELKAQVDALEAKLNGMQPCDADDPDRQALIAEYAALFEQETAAANDLAKLITDVNTQLQALEDALAAAGLDQPQ